MLQELFIFAHKTPTLPIHNYYAAFVLPLQARLLVAPPSSLNTTLRAVLLFIAIGVAFFGETVDTNDNFVSGANYKLLISACCMHSVHLAFTARSQINPPKADRSSKHYHRDLGWSGALEVLTSFRGISMNWGVPSEKLPPVYENFLSDTLLDIVRQHFISRTAKVTLARFVQDSSAGISGEFVRHITISITMIILSWSDVTMVYGVVRLFVYTFTKLCGQHFDKSKWPPLYSDIFAADSVRTFWNNKWHCLFKRHMTLCGYKPAFNLINALLVPGDIPHYSGIIGAFAFSGLFHEYCFRCTSRTMFMEQFPSLTFFLINALAIIFENEVKKYTGRTVGGIYGRLWAYAIIIFSSIPMNSQILLGIGPMPGFKGWDTWKWYVPLSLAMKAED
ncbi:hypothetical protein E3P81_00445 [Wallemia ichthyophaga]|nr:hypothetical protein E3P97_00447 [Wallemia ichthyophaga]TIB04252.1 hypothetical protein E3P96_01652 [Wallemia ichthyophaga]TIB35481.1 hypothetical protein E3P85_00447 [Wallemia ichthyophaga]TIB50699.1 hypothetical protein E3P82_00447 [Wallemia ichthyophaga]TIB54257.1 hypothetical protein E3P81_00445 [Wallemia ichthyophaga]